MVWKITKPFWPLHFAEKNTGYVCRPELQRTKETIFLVNAFLTDCRDSQNYNLPMRVSSYFTTPRVRICMKLKDPAIDVIRCTDGEGLVSDVVICYEGFLARGVAFSCLGFTLGIWWF